MPEETDEMVSTIQTLTKENDGLRGKVVEYEKLKSDLAEKELAKLVTDLVEKTGKDAKEFEGKPLEVLKELLKLVPEKEEEKEEEEKVEEKPKSKGISETKVKTKPINEKEDPYEVNEKGQLTLSESGWNEWDNKLSDLDWVSKEVIFRPKGE